MESFVTCFRRCCVQWSLIACVALVGCGGGSGDADVQELRGQLNHERASIRRAAIKKLEKIGPRAAPAVDDLAVFLNDEDPQMRYRAIKALSNIGRHSKRAIDDVSLLLTSDDDQKVRYYAAKTLDQFAKEAGPAVEALTAGLADDYEKVRYYCAKTLGKLGAEAHVALDELEAISNDPDKDVQQAVKDAIRRIKKKRDKIK